MPSLNTNEYGQVLRANIGQDVSTATGYTFVLQPKVGQSTNTNATASTQPDGAVIRTGTDVTLGTTDVTVGDETYLANQYVNYTVKENDLSHSGLWRFKGEATMSTTNKIVGDYKLLTVLD
jgi:hypothetical protein